MKSPFISKSKYLSGLQCRKLLWFYYNAKDLIPASPKSFANPNLLRVFVEFISFSGTNFFAGTRMPYDPLRHHRRSIRLPGYDYAQPGMYYVTLTIRNREQILGSVVDGEIQLSKLGEIAGEEWLRTPIIRPEVKLDEFVIMPDHLHGIIEIREERNGVSLVGANSDSPQRITPFRSPSRTVGAIIRGFKGASTKRINEERGTPGARLWQRNYYEHIIRDERDFRRIQTYILENPLRFTLEEG